MIKFFRNQDIIVTSFTVAKEQTLNSVLNDLIIANEGDDLFPLVTPTVACNDNFSGSCAPEFVSGFLAVSQFDDPIDFQIGKYIHSSSVFYPTGSIEYNATSNPMNLAGTYQRQVFNTIKNMYYNDYNNAYNIFGFDGYDTENASLHLTNDFSTINLRVDQAGDKIRPNTLVLNNQSGDIVADIIDDGNYNLILSGSYFINKYSLVGDSYDLTTPSNICGVGSYLSNPTRIKPCCASPIPCGGVLSALGGTVPDPYYTDYYITLGDGLGLVTLDFTAYAVPDRFEVIYNGGTVIDTDWRATRLYPNPANPSYTWAMVLAAIDPQFVGATVITPGNGSVQFNKTSVAPEATLRVWSPLPNTQWEATLGCPIAITPCGTEVTVSGGTIPDPYYIEYPISIDSSTGVVTLSFASVGHPCKFELFYDGLSVIVTDWMSWESNPIVIAALVAQLASYGFPGAVISYPFGAGALTFNKMTSTTLATLRIYSPFPVAGYAATVGCPI